MDPLTLELALKMHFDVDSACSIHEIVQKTGVSLATFYRYLNRKPVHGSNLLKTVHHTEFFRMMHCFFITFDFQRYMFLRLEAHRC